MVTVAHHSSLKHLERGQLKELRGKALKLAGWIAYNEATGNGPLEYNTRQLDELLKSNSELLEQNPSFQETLLAQIERVKNPEQHIKNEAVKLAQWISYDLSKGDEKTAAINQEKLDSLLSKHADYFAKHPDAARRIGEAVEKSRNSVSKSKVTTSVQSAALSESAEKESAALGEALGLAKASGEKQNIETAQAALNHFREKNRALISSYGEKLFDDSIRASEARGSQKWLDAVKDVTTIHSSLGHLSANKEAIYSALSQRKDESVADWKSRLETLKEAHQSLYHRSLEGDLRYYLRGASEERAVALLRADRVSSRLEQLKEARGVIVDNKESIFKAYQGLSKEEVSELNRRIEDHWKKQYGESYAKGLARSLQFSNHEYRAIEAARQGDELGVQTYTLRDAQNNLFSREKAVNTILEANRHQMGALREDYAEKIHGTPKGGGKTRSALESDLRKNLSAGESKEQAVANVQERFIDADTHRLREAVRERDQKEISAVLQGKSQEERAALEAAYNKLPGSSQGGLRSDIRGMKDGEVQAEIITLLNNGKLSRVEQFRRAARGLGTDVQEMLSALCGMTKSEVAEFRTEYKERYGEDPLQVIEIELSGDDLFDAREALLGLPETGKERVARAEARARYERSGLLSSVIALVDQDAARIQDEALSRLRRDKDPVSAELFERAAQGFREAKNSTADTAGNIAGVVAAGAVTSATAGLGAPISMLSIGAASFGGSALTKIAVKGFGFGAEEMGIDLVSAGAEGIAFGVGARLARFGVQRLTSERSVQVVGELLEEVGNGGVSGAIQGGAHADWRSDPSSALKTVLMSSLVGAVAGTVGGSTGSLASRRLEANLEREIERAVAERLTNLSAKTKNLSAEARQAVIEQTARELSGRVLTQLKQSMIQAGAGGVTSGAVSAAAELPTGISAEDAILLILSNSGTSGGFGMVGAAGIALGAGRLGATRNEQRANVQTLDVGEAQRSFDELSLPNAQDSKLSVGSAQPVNNLTSKPDSNLQTMVNRVALLEPGSQLVISQAERRFGGRDDQVRENHLSLEPTLDGQYLLTDLTKSEKFTVSYQTPDGQRVTAQEAQQWHAVVPPGTTVHLGESGPSFVLPFLPEETFLQRRISFLLSSLREEGSVVVSRDELFQNPIRSTEGSFHSIRFYRAKEGIAVTALTEKADVSDIWWQTSDGSFSLLGGEMGQPQTLPSGAVLRIGKSGPTFTLTPFSPPDSHLRALRASARTYHGDNRPLVRYSGYANEVQPDYAENAKNARVFFDNYFFEGDLSPSGFRAANIEMHKLSVYQGKSAPGGELRREAALSRRTSAADYVDKIFSRFGRAFVLGEIPNGPITVDGISVIASPMSYHRDELRGLHVYPNGRELGEYFKQGAELLLKIKERLLAESKTEVDRQDIIDLIGQYYHVMVNARPFRAVNNSLFMNQVNYLLALNGSERLTHHELDHLFMRINSDQAKKLWRLAVQRKLPHATQLGLPRIE